MYFDERIFFFFFFLAGLCFCIHCMWAFSSFSKWELSTCTGWTLGYAASVEQHVHQGLWGLSIL